MPLVFGGAPIVNVLYSMITSPPKTAPNPMLYLGIRSGVARGGDGAVLPAARVDTESRSTTHEDHPVAPEACGLWPRHSARCLARGSRTASSRRPAASPSQPDPNSGPLRIRLPVITVTAEKVPEDAQKTPVSLTAVPNETLEQARCRAASATPPTSRRTRAFNEFSARKLSNPRFRGVGSSPNNPGVTTYIDGVPQLNANSSSLELPTSSRSSSCADPRARCSAATASADSSTSRACVRRSATGPAASSPVWQLQRGATCAAAASGPVDAEQAGGRPGVRLLGARRLHGERRHRRTTSTFGRRFSPRARSS